jgi:hypothetical protein
MAFDELEHGVRLIALHQVLELLKIEGDDFREDVGLTSPVIDTTHERLTGKSARESACPPRLNPEEEARDPKAE